MKNTNSYCIVDERGNVMYRCSTRPEAERVYNMLTEFFVSTGIRLLCEIR